MHKKKMSRRSTKKLLPVWMPVSLVDWLDEGVRAQHARLEEADRSKFVRAAIREKLSRLGVRVPGEPNRNEPTTREPHGSNRTGRNNT